MPDGFKFPKLRKFSLHAPEASDGGLRVLEYTNYEFVPPVTYRLEEQGPAGWSWEILQSGWQLSHSPEERLYASNLDAYHALRKAVTS